MGFVCVYSKQMLQKQSAGARMLTRHLEKESVLKKEGEYDAYPMF